MSVIGVGRRAGSTFKSVEVRCHACASTTMVSFRHPDDIARLLSDRGWSNTKGVIACRSHSAEMMPRHVPLAVARARRAES